MIRCEGCRRTLGEAVGSQIVIVDNGRVVLQSAGDGTSIVNVECAHCASFTRRRLDLSGIPVSSNAMLG